MSPADAAAPVASVLQAELGAFTLTVLAGVIVSLISLWCAARQRTRQEERAETRRREAVLYAIGYELRRNRVATRGKLDASNAHVTVGALTTIAFERHGDELASIAPESVASVYEHYGLVATVREGIRALGPPGTVGHGGHRETWIDLCHQASVEVGRSANRALNSLGLPVED